jgi:hypothetical protein
MHDEVTNFNLTSPELQFNMLQQTNYSLSVSMVDEIYPYWDRQHYQADIMFFSGMLLP